tara:strand:- start:1088 stop:1600 length:513 start_codon:yes stop_codon:yes gene_type:complete
MKELILILLLLPFAVYSNYSLENNHKELFLKNRRAKYPVGINFVGFGPSGVAGLSMDWFIKPKFNLEFGAGLNDLKIFQPSYFAGGKYHFFGNTISNTTIYLGFFDKVTIDSIGTNNLLYIPIGLQRIKKNKLTWNIEVAYTYDIDTFKSNVYGAFKLGYRLNRFGKKRK